ncbi:MAG: hypothetical protein ABJN69_02000 [Hellea sp.]
MTKEEWETSRSAPDMLTDLHIHNPEYFKSLIPVLHRYFLACCWKIEHLLPQKHLRNGIVGAEKWIKGEIDDDELNRLNWYAEAECFAIDYAKTSDEIEEIQMLINGIEQLQGLPFDDAKNLLKRAAYFAEISMLYPKINHAPFVKSLCTSQFLCPDLLRQFLEPNFHETPNKGSLDIDTKDSQLMTAFGKVKGPLPEL